MTRKARSDTLLRLDLVTVLSVTRALAAPFDLRSMLTTVTRTACSVLRAENEDVAAPFGARHPDFKPLAVADLLTELKVPASAGLCAPAEAADGVAAGQYLRMWPHRHHTDGFFAAVWQRAG